MQKIVVGIDPGLSGGLTCLVRHADGHEMVVRSIPMPLVDKGILNTNAIVLFLQAHKPSKIIIEKVGSMPKQGIASAFKFGYVCGIIEGICAAMDIPFEFVTPQKWQKAVLSGKGIPSDVAKPSTVWAARTYPGYNWLATERSRVPHDGMTDSAALAQYGLSLG